MSNIKYCPNCQKENHIDEAKCSCGFEFVIKEVVDETVSTNTTVIVDNVPLFVWKIIAFFCPIAGFILKYKYRNKYPERSKICGSVALGTTIFVACSILLIVLIVIGFLTGNII